jgi:hypothetical protein
VAAQKGGNNDLKKMRSASGEILTFSLSSLWAYISILEGF